MMIEEDQRWVFLVRRKIKWHRLQMKKEQMINAQLREKLLRINEYLEENLKTEN